MSLRATLASSNSFAHLLTRKKSVKAAKADDMDDDDAAKKSKKAKTKADEDGGDLDDVDDNEDDKKEKLDDAVDDETDDDGLADDDEDGEDEDNAKKAKKSKKAVKAESGDDDDDDDKKDEGAKKARTARLTERARCKAIFSSPYAAGRPHVAAKLAFDTNMTAKDAIGVLAATASEDEDAPDPKKAKSADLRTRMSTQQNPDVGSDGAPEKKLSGPKAFAAAVLAADKWRRNEA